MPASGQANLRVSSKGARYLHVRIAYYVYSQVTRTDKLEPVEHLHHPDGWLHAAKE